MRVCLWSIACGELCYGSQWTCCWWALRFSNEGSLGMCLRACSQSLGVFLWSLPPLLCLFLNMALKSTWGFWKANTEQQHIEQVRVQGYHRSIILSTEWLISGWRFPRRKCWEWLMPIVHSDCYNRFRLSLSITCTAGTWILKLLLGDVLQEERIPMINHYGTHIVISMPVALFLKKQFTIYFLSVRGKYWHYSRVYPLNIEGGS